MGSSRPTDRSLGSGISFPQWMRSKVDSRFDFDQSSFSPPSHDDSFFYIRYPSSSNTSQPQQEGFRTINEFLHDQKPAIEASKSLTSESTSKISTIKETKNIDFSKLPLSCQPFIPVANKEYELKNAHKFEAKGTDDGFHSEPARCGKSIVHVANRIMQSSTGNKKMENKQLSKMEKNDELTRKGSRSLPVSPISTPTSTPEGSPKSRRRGLGNRFFTGAFIPDRDKYQGGWLLSSILGQSREIVGNKIEEVDETLDVVPARALNRKKSISSQNLSYLGKEEITPGKTTNTTVTFEAKPSELREMNFWSPTSM
jgi:hypothetical protein